MDPLRSREIALKAILKLAIIESGTASHPSAVDDLANRARPFYDLSEDGTLMPNTRTPHRENAPGKMTLVEYLDALRHRGEAAHLFASHASARDISAASTADDDFFAMTPEEKMAAGCELTRPKGWK